MAAESMAGGGRERGAKVVAVVVGWGWKSDISEDQPKSVAAT